MKNKKFKFIALGAITALMFSPYAKGQEAVKVQETTTIRETPVAVTNTTESTELKRGEFGIRYMPTFIKIDVRDSKGEEVPGTVSFQQGFGIMLGINITEHVGVQGEINYLQISQKYKDVTLNREVKIRYINIPLLLSLNTNKSGQFNLNFVVGPEFGFNTGYDVRSDGYNGSDSINAVVVLKKSNVGLAYGAGLEFAINKDHTLRFDLGYRGFYNFVDVAGTGNTFDNYNVVVKVPRNRNSLYAGFTIQF